MAQKQIKVQYQMANGKFKLLGVYETRWHAHKDIQKKCAYWRMLEGRKVVEQRLR